VLRVVGRIDQAEQFDRKVRAAQSARDEILALYQQADAEQDLGIVPHPELYHRLADLRERMGRIDEAVAWHHVVLKQSPKDPISHAALLRLQATSTVTDARAL
jgi:hypothetical protein